MSVTCTWHWRSFSVEITLPSPRSHSVLFLAVAPEGCTLTSRPPRRRSYFYTLCANIHRRSTGTARCLYDMYDGNITGTVNILLVFKTDNPLRWSGWILGYVEIFGRPYWETDILLVILMKLYCAVYLLTLFCTPNTRKMLEMSVCFGYVLEFRIWYLGWFGIFDNFSRILKNIPWLVLDFGEILFGSMVV